ncbi:hypothetical protein LIER_02945 [Lithospermum erythrorhizon]|uniref:Uncharacterized protein n=1 Tax=Lithospermum erythrorhizon TaxID=34254 RepID=A0AAV3NSZ7_LITER
MDDKDGYHNYFGRQRKIAGSTIPHVLIRNSITESSRENPTTSHVLPLKQGEGCSTPLVPGMEDDSALVQPVPGKHATTLVLNPRIRQRWAPRLPWSPILFPLRPLYPRLHRLLVLLIQPLKSHLHPKREKGLLYRVLGQHVLREDRTRPPSYRSESREEFYPVGKREAFMREIETLRTGRDEALEANNHLLGKLEESRTQVRIIEVGLEGTQSVEGLRDLLQGLDAGRELLIQFFDQALARTIQVVQDKLDEASLEVPTSLWESMRDDVSLPDPSGP